MIQRRHLGLPVSIFVSASLACNRAPESKTTAIPYPAPVVHKDGERIAQVGSVVFTTEEMWKRARAQSPALVERFTADATRRRDFVKQQVQFELLAQESWARRLHEDPGVLEELKKIMVQRLVRDEVEKRLKDRPVFEAELMAAYEKAHNEFHKPETVRLSQIVRRAKGAAEQAKERAMLERVRLEILTAEAANRTTAFAEAARAFSQDDDTKNGGGDLPFLSEVELIARAGDEAAKVIFSSTKVGELAIVHAADAVILFKKTGRREAIAQTLDQVRPKLHARVMQDKRNQVFEEWAAELETKFGAAIDTTKVDAMTPPKEAPAP